MDLATTEIATTPETQVRKTITLRAFLLGVATMLISTVYMDYHAGNLVKSYLPVAVCIPFLGWVLLNAGLKILAPRIALEHNEILTIFGMVWVGGNLPAVGWALHSVSAIPAGGKPWGKCKGYGSFHADHQVHVLVKPSLERQLFAVVEWDLSL